MEKDLIGKHRLLEKKVPVAAEIRRFQWQTKNPYILQKERELLGIISTFSAYNILEVGCGEAANLVNLRAMGIKARFFGVDFSCDKALFCNAQRLKDAFFMCADARTLPFRDRAFDIVFCRDLLHHVDDNRREVVAEMIRVSRGKVIILEGNGDKFINFVFRLLSPQERGMKHSNIISMRKLLVSFKGEKEIRAREPSNLFRFILHYDYGIPRLAYLKIVSVLLDGVSKLARIFTPPDKWAYILAVLNPSEINGNNRAEKERVFFDIMAISKGASWWGNVSPAGQARQKMRAELSARYTNMTWGKEVLEVGCATGDFTKNLCMVAKGAKITAVDISPKLIEIVNKTIDYPNLKFEVGNMEHLEYKDEAFDIIVGNSVLHHVELCKVLPELIRLLKKEGMIFFSEPNMLNPQIFLERNVAFLRRLLQVSPEETAFSRWHIKKILEIYGFKDVRVIPFDFLHPLTPKQWMPFVKRLSYLLEKTPLIKEIAGSLLIVGKK